MINLRTSDAPKVSVVILCQNNLTLLASCLSSITNTVDGIKTPYEVIILFQQMSPASTRSFLSDIKGARILHAHLNLGFAGGINHAVRHAKGHFLAFLNDDTITHDGWLQWLVRAVESDEKIGAAGSRIIFPDGTLQEAGAIVWSDGSCFPLGRYEKRNDLSYSYVRPVDYISANGLLMRRKTFDDAGGFNEDYFPGYYEDVDLCMTIRHELGQSVILEPRSVISHYESATAGRDPNFRKFLFDRHQRIFKKRWSHVLTTYPAPEPESAPAVERAVLRARGNPARVLVIDDRVPSAPMGSGASRIVDMVADLAEVPYALTLATTDRRSVSVGNPLAEFGVDLVQDAVEDVVRKGRRYSAVIISRPHNFRPNFAAIRAALPEATIMYDVEALYHRRLLLEANIENNAQRRKEIQAQADDMEYLEIEIARAVDRLVAISDSEVKWLEGIAGHAPIDYVRPLSPRATMMPAKLRKRDGALFVAGWLAGEHSPNVGALEWYAKNVLPRVRRVIPNFVTRVTGNNAPLRVQILERDGIELVGTVSLENAYQSARVAIAPVLAGAGVKIKTIESLQYGVPVVATTVGAEGLGLTNGQEIDITDDPTQFADKLIELCRDDELWLRRREHFSVRVAAWEAERVSWAHVIQKAIAERTTICKFVSC